MERSERLNPEPNRLELVWDRAEKPGRTVACRAAGLVLIHLTCSETRRSKKTSCLALQTFEFHPCPFLILARQTLLVPLTLERPVSGEGRHRLPVIMIYTHQRLHRLPRSLRLKPPHTNPEYAKCPSLVLIYRMIRPWSLTKKALWHQGLLQTTLLKHGVPDRIPT